MQGEDVLKTVEECLRGRLLAERAASETATATADLFTVKVKELEEKLKIEEKCRRKAEMKFKKLMRKLENLKIGFNYNDNSIYESGDECSIISFSIDLEFSEKSTNSNSRSATSSNNGDQHARSIESETNVEKDQEARNLSGLKPSTLEKGREKEESQRGDDLHHDDDSMAIVPLKLPIKSKDPPNNEVLKVNNERVREVIDTLKQIRKNIQSTMEGRKPIQVG